MALSKLSGKRLKMDSREGDDVATATATTPGVLLVNEGPPKLEHPLMDDLILKHMFEYCGPRELNNCRLICRQWEQVSFPVWLKNDPPPIRLEFASSKYDSVDRKKLEKFLEDFPILRRRLERADEKGETTQFHRKYRKFNIRMSADTPQSLFNLFWTTCGEWVTHLELCLNCSCEDMSRTLVQEVLACRHTPNLEQLSLKLLDSCKIKIESGNLACFQGENKVLKTFKLNGAIGGFNWREFLNHYSALQELRFDLTINCSVLTLDSLRNVLIAIKDIRLENDTKLQLKTLSWFEMGFYGYVSEQDLPNLAEVCQVLGELRLELLNTFGVYVNEDAEDSAVHQLCSLYSKTLKELSIHKKSPLNNSSTFFTGMQLEHLQVLNVGGDVFTNLLFLQHLPNLRSLKFSKTCPVSRSIIRATTASNHDDAVFVFPRITQFSCDWMSVIWNDQDINKLRELMPNLTSLEMRLDNASFRRVCGNFPNLVHLVVLGTALGDEGITGLTKTDWGVTLQKPNIPYLKKLRHFIMHDEGYSTDEGKLTKHSVYQGFLKLPMLETLSVRLSSDRMDRNTRLLLREKIPFTKLVIWENYYHSSEWF